MVHEEPEDIFAIRTEQKDEMMSTDPSKIVIALLLLLSTRQKAFKMRRKRKNLRFHRS
jgi:hypothetical protein